MIRATILPTVCLRKAKGSLKRTIEIKVRNSSAVETLEGELRLGRTVYPVKLPIPRGDSRHRVEVDEPTRPSDLTLRPTGHHRFGETEVTIAPQRTWEIYLLQHSHTDLGYTHLPTLVQAVHADYVDRAVAYCRDTEKYPKHARFRWNLEVSWQLRNYILRRPASAVAELVKLLKEGRIDLSAWYLNMTDVGSVEETLRAHYFVHDFCRDHNVPLRASMSCDVNGYPWCLPTVLGALGVRRHLSALNTTRSISPLDRPCAFWWESPDGARVLVWHGEHYHFGNYLGLADQQEHLFERLSEHLQKLEHKGYPYPMALIQVSGTYSDNAPPSRALSDFVRSWNRRWHSPRIRLCTISEWFGRLGRELGNDIPVYRQAWPDYWADGLGSAPYETRLARNARHILPGAEAAHSALHMLRGDHQPLPLDNVYEEATLANEHTWGYHASVGDPFHPQSLAHWNHKAGFFYRATIGADSILRESTRHVAGCVRNPEPKRIVVFNWLSWPRGGLVEAAVPIQWIPEARGFRILDAETGEEIRYQIVAESRHELRIAFHAPSIPALGYRVFSLRPGEPAISPPTLTSDKGPKLENGFFRLQVDRSGAIRSLWDKALAKELVNQKHAHRLGQLISEAIIHEEGREALNGWWFYTHRNKSPESGIFRRKESGHGRILRRDAGPVFSELEVESRNPALQSQRMTIRLFENEGTVLLRYRLRKPLNPDPEALYIAFPFDLPHPIVRLDAAGGPYRPGQDQIEGSCMDFYTLQDWATLHNDEVSVLWVPLDAPLVQLHTITTARWIRKPPVHSATFYSWTYNNYWTTNFPVIACGDLEFRYLIRTSRPPLTPGEAGRFAAEAFSPLTAEPVSGPREGSLPEFSGSLFEVAPVNVDCIALKPRKSGSGFVLRLQEKDGRETEASVRFRLLRPVAVNRVTPFEEDEPGSIRMREGGCQVHLPPFGIRTLHILPEGTV